jgi:DNA-binding NarL/FixJ family response regulator
VDTLDYARVALVDDHPSVLAGLKTAFPATTRISAHRSIVELLGCKLAFDLVILDVRLNDGSTPEDNVAKCVERHWPVLLYTVEANAAVIQRCMLAGAMGLIEKHEDLAMIAVGARRVLAGEPHLTSGWARAIEGGAGVPALSARESEALRLYARGLPLKSVAARMHVSQETAKDYLLRVRAKYDAVGRPAVTKIDLHTIALEDGYLPLSRRIVGS